MSSNICFFEQQKQRKTIESMRMEKSSSVSFLMQFHFKAKSAHIYSSFGSCQFAF